MEQNVSVGAGLAPAQVAAKPELKEIDKLKLEKLNLSISNISLQIDVANEKVKGLRTAIVSFLMEREGLVRGIVESSDYAAGNGKWRLNPDTMIFEAVEAGEKNALERFFK